MSETTIKCSICDSQFPTEDERDDHYVDCFAKDRHLTRRQADVLLVVTYNGPVTARDVAMHLPVGESSARGVLARLEKKGLIDAMYTGHDRRGGRAFVARRGA